MTLPATTGESVDPAPAPSGRQALCCTCGSLRTCHRPRNHRQENYWLAGTVDRNWHRETADLKCGVCRQVTRHALLVRGQSDWRDHAEELQRIALGGDTSSTWVDVRRIREQYRAGARGNPYRSHIWYRGDAEKAKKEQTFTVTAFCGEVVDLSPTRELAAAYDFLPSREKPLADSGDEPVAPRIGQGQRHDQDCPPEGWDVLDCPDCLRSVNAQRLKSRRTKLLSKLLELSSRTFDLDSASIDRLLGLTEELS